MNLRKSLKQRSLKLLEDIGVKLKPEEITVAHNLGKPRDGGRPLIVPFVLERKEMR